MPAAVASPASSNQLHAGPAGRMSQEVSPHSTYRTLKPVNQEQRRSLSHGSPPIVTGEGPAQQPVSPEPRRISPNSSVLPPLLHCSSSLAQAMINGASEPD